MRTLHCAYRVTDLDASVDFYTALGYSKVGRVDLGGGNSLTMLKFPGDEFVTFELAHRPGDGPVVIGSGFSHLAVKVDDLAATTAALSRDGLRPVLSKRRADRTDRGPRGLPTQTDTASSSFSGRWGTPTE